MKLKLYIEYAGHNYSGWQKQTGQSKVKTVQGTLINAIQTVLKNSKANTEFKELYGAGRTDAGVHAIEQIAHLDCETMLAPEILKMKINDELPSDINILEIEKAPKDFHARHDAKSRQYLYVISKRRTAFEKRFVWWIKDSPDVKKMKEAAELFIGMHDFKNFAEKTPSPTPLTPSPKERGSQLKEGNLSTKCKVESLIITEKGDKIFISIKASHFLWKMVRRIVGTLVEAGRGNVKAGEINFLLDNKAPLLFKDKSKAAALDPAKLTAPPSGLFLEKIYY